MLKKGFLFILGMLGIIGMLSLVSPYTAPSFDSVNFSLCSGYTAPSFDSINFTLGDEDSCVTDSCTYSSGDWEVTCDDNCSITDVTEMDGGDLVIAGTGYFHVGANITNFGKINLSEGCYMFFDDGVYAVSS